MTTQEAIERIKYRIYTATAIAGKGEDGKAFEDLEMAIEALERQISSGCYEKETTEMHRKAYRAWKVVNRH